MRLAISLYEHDYSLPYPVFASFQDWLFPHRNIPTTWTDCPQIPPPPTERNFAASQWSTAVTVRDQCCRLTGALAYCEVAHLIPVKETAWFDKGRMGRYGMPPQTTIHNTRNLLLLRSDMHKLLDTFQWVIYPKTERVGEATKTRLVFHLMDPVPQLRELYHNVPLRETPGLRLEYLLSAFALAIFPRMAEFLRCHADRYLIQVKANAEKGKSELVTGSKLAQDYSAPGTHPSRSSNSSPSKRSRRESESPTKRQEMDTYDQSDMQTKSHGQVTTLCTNQQKRRSSFDPVQAAHGPDERAIPNPPKRIQRTIFSTGLSDEPCTCPHHLEPLALTSADGSRISVEADDDSWQEFKLCGSQNCLTSLELDRFTTLRERALYDERAKSGTEKSWTDSTAWLRQTLERGGGISPWEIKRWKWIEGGESEEQDGEEGELDFLRDEAN